MSPRSTSSLTSVASNRNSTIRQSAPSDSGSDSDVYGGARGRDFAKRNRRRLQGASSRSTPAAAEVRFSTRRAAKITTYNEEDGDSFDEEDSENLTPNHWATAEDDTPAIDVVLNHRLMEGKGAYLLVVSVFRVSFVPHADRLFMTDSVNPTKHDYEFFVRIVAFYHAMLPRPILT